MATAAGCFLLSQKKKKSKNTTWTQTPPTDSGFTDLLSDRATAGSEIPHSRRPDSAASCLHRRPSVAMTTPPPPNQCIHTYSISPQTHSPSYSSHNIKKTLEKLLYVQIILQNFFFFLLRTRGDKTLHVTTEVQKHTSTVLSSI